MRRGQSLIEILIAVAVGAILVVGTLSIIAPTLKTSGDATRVQVASALGKELLDNARVMFEGNWHIMDNMSTSSANRYFLNSSASPFGFATGTESQVLPNVLTSLIAYWKLDEGVGSSTADFGGSGYTGTLYNDTSWVTGYLGDALSFGGNTAQVVTNSATALKYTGGDMTLSMWVKPDATDDGGYILSKPWNGGGQYNYTIDSAGGSNPTIGVQLSGATSYSLGSSKTISAGIWHHVLVTFSSSSNVAIYLDGALANSGTHGIASWTPGSGDANISLVLGCIYPYASNNCAGATTYDYKGLLDDVRIYNRVLTAGEISSLYKSAFYTRYFYLDDVYRDAGGLIDAGGSTFDPSTKKITVVYGWGNVFATSTSYLVRSEDQLFSQVDWSGGPGQSGPITSTSTNNKFSVATNTDYSTSSGSLVIQGF